MTLAAGWLWHWDRVRQEWEGAQSSLQRHDLAAAQSFLQRYLQYRPGDAGGWFLAARTARRLGQITEAERLLERCQEVGGVTEATRLEWSLLRVQQGDVGEVDGRLRMTIGPDHPDALVVLEALAKGYLKAERLSDARQACELGLQRQPNEPWPYLWRGWIYDRLGHYDKALVDYQRAVELAPDDPQGRLALGGLLFRLVQFNPAVEHYETILARSPDNEEALLGLAACRIEQGRSDQAVPLLDRVLAGNPSSPRGLALQGKAALQRAGPAVAERWLREAIQRAPDNAEALYQLVQSLRMQGKETEAGELDRRLEQLQSDLHRLDDLVRAVGRQPDDAAARHEAGLIALRIGRTEEGLRWLKGALRGRGDHRPTHAALADFYRQQGDQSRAEEHQRLAETP